jgi:lipoprotein-anchoring transpeptidase ErfK/SrfK
MLRVIRSCSAGLRLSIIAVSTLVLVVVMVASRVPVVPAQAVSTGLANSAASVTVSTSADSAVPAIPGQAVDSAFVSQGSTDSVSAARSGKWIEIILSQQKLIAWQNGVAVMSSAISSGVARYPTRRGTFHIYVKYRSTRMRGPGYNLPNVPYTMYYSGSYGIHGTYWHHNFGHPMSHGCINLPTSFARQLYYWAPLGTTVVIH